MTPRSTNVAPRAERHRKMQARLTTIATLSPFLKGFTSPYEPYEIFHESLIACLAHHRDVNVAAARPAAALFTKTTTTHPRQISFANREERNTSTDCYEATARDVNAMVKKTGAGRGGIGRVRAPWI